MSSLVQCRLCGAEQARVAFVANDYFTGQTFEIRECAECAFAFTWPRPASLDKFYPPQYRRYGGLTAWLFATLDGHRAATVARAIAPRGRALEIGCGPGWMSEAVRRIGWQVVSNERVVDAATIATRKRGLSLFVGGLDAVKSDAQFDLVIIHQVLEHLDEPLATLEAIARVLKPGGTVLIGVPNYASWQARCTCRHWQHLEVPRHLSHFTPATLQVACQRAGLQVVNTRFISLERDPFGWLQSLLNKLGFTQNLLWLWLTGEQHQRICSAEGILMILAGTMLAGPSYLLAMVSWVFGRGSIMEVIARRPGL
jgi:SAM-dependent methyltransferase